MDALHAAGGGLVLAFKIPHVVEQIGSIAGFAAVLGLAILSGLYFSQARDVKRLREWAGRAPERAAEGTAPGYQPVPGRAAPLVQRVPQQTAAQPQAAAGTAAATAAGAAGAATATEPEAGEAAAATNGGSPPQQAGADAGEAEKGDAAETEEPGADKTPPAEGEGGDDAKSDGAPSDGAPSDGAPATTGPPPATPAGGKPAAPAPAGAGAAAAAAAGAGAAGTGAAGATPGGPATPPRTGTSVLPPRTSPPRTGSTSLPARRGPSGSQPSAAGPAGRPPSSARKGRNPRYVALTIAGILILGGAGAFGIPKLLNGGDEPTSKTPAGKKKKAASGASKTGAVAKPAEITVSILNGTTVPGLAAQVGDRVEADGFTLGTVSNASGPQRADSVAMYAAGHQRDARSVARKLSIKSVEPVDAESQAIAGDATVVVIVGSDQTQ